MFFFLTYFFPTLHVMRHAAKPARREWLWCDSNPGEVFFEGGLDTPQSQSLVFFEGIEGELQSDQFGVDTMVSSTETPSGLEVGRSGEKVSWDLILYIAQSHPESYEELPRTCEL